MIAISRRSSRAAACAGPAGNTEPRVARSTLPSALVLPGALFAAGDLIIETECGDERTRCVELAGAGGALRVAVCTCRQQARVRLGPRRELLPRIPDRPVS